MAVARKTGGRPVRLAQSVPESMLTTRRHSATVRIKTGFKRDGTLLAREAEVVMDTGAYADNGPRVAKRAISRMIGPYKLRDCKVDVSAVYTNTVPAGSMRSIGGPQTIWALESHMDTIAHRLGVDPLEFRMRNLLDRGEALKAGATPIDADLRQGTKIAADGVSWTALNKNGKRPGYRGRSFRFRSHAGFRRSGTAAGRWQRHFVSRHHRSGSRGAHHPQSNRRA